MSAPRFAKTADKGPMAAPDRPQTATRRPESDPELLQNANIGLKSGQEGSWSGLGAILARFQNHLGAKNVDFR